ncbi:hypothetical protein MPER_07795, partial [Moniliophthora perniciosa FA553]
MAFSDNSPGANASSSKSRLSSLKVFKNVFSKEKDSLKPPPLPPKDPFYLNNRSLVSLQYPSESMPATPVTPHSIGTAYATSNTVLGTSQSQYAPTSSSASLASSPSDAGAPSLLPLPKQPSQKKSGFLNSFKRGTKSPSLRSASVDDEMPSLQSNGEDENISTPYNFQHNIHVDDGLAGMPPSWTVSLAKAGFTEEEIAAIYARKQAGTLTPGNDFGSPYHSSYGSDRPKSPAAMSIASSAAASSLQRPGTSTSSHG